MTLPIIDPAAVERGIARANADCDLARTVDAPPHGRPQVATVGRVSGVPLLLPGPQPIAAGELDASRVSGTDRGHTTAALEGHPVSLFDSGTPAARTTDPATAHAAAASVTDIARRDIYAKVLAALKDGPASDFDLARFTGRKQTSVGVRRKELERAGLVRLHDSRGVSDTGSACNRYVLTEAGRTAA